MATYVFNGKVLPERANVNVAPLEFRATFEEPRLNLHASLSIGASQMSALVSVSDGDADLFTLKNYLEYLIRFVVDACGYLWGCGYDVEVTAAVDAEGNQVVFGVGIPELEESKDERPLTFSELLGIAARSAHLRRALADLREAIRSPWDTGFFCFRAVESIRQAFVMEEDGEKKERSWERLLAALRIDRSCLKGLEKYAVPQRHGETPYMSGEDRVSAMRHAWKVIDRFCVYAHRGFTPLAEEEFDFLIET